MAELSLLPNVFEPTLVDLLSGKCVLRGLWKKNFFKNMQPIILEVGCGRGYFCIAAAHEYPELNFLGIDIKGHRLWHGARIALEQGLKNVGFVRMQAIFLPVIFEKEEIQEIWITFPDPRESKPRQRFYSTVFFEKYRQIMVDDGTVNLKTDSSFVFYETIKAISYVNGRIVKISEDLPENAVSLGLERFQTQYERRFRNEGKQIKYLKFSFKNNLNLEKN